MKKHLKYLSYVLRHKYFVFRAGLDTKAPIWRLIIHDWSKFTRSEWGAYARRFYGGRSGIEDKTADPDEFRKAWLHHLHRNPHHWLHWVLLLEDGTRQPVRMPEHFVREMVADWMGAGRAITGHWDIQEWWGKNAHTMLLHPQTYTDVIYLLQDNGIVNG